MAGVPILTALPLAGFMGFALVFGVVMSSPKEDIAVGYLDRPMPEFAQPPMVGLAEGFSSADLGGQVALINVFASWCGACRQEHPVLMDLAQSEDVPFFGLNWKDRRGGGKLFLMRNGNPYAATGDDTSGTLGDQFGVTGVPETYVVDANNRLRYRHLGPITPEIWNDVLKPLITRLESEA